VQTDFSGLHKREDSLATNVLFRQQKDAVHAALGVSTYGESGRLLLGVRGHVARGNILIADAALAQPGFVALPQSEWGLNLLVSGTITFRAVRDAAEKAIPLAPRNSSRGDKEDDEEEVEEL
jgi:hypothetical protein